MAGYYLGQYYYSYLWLFYRKKKEIKWLLQNAANIAGNLLKRLFPAIFSGIKSEETEKLGRVPAATQRTQKKLNRFNVKTTTKNPDAALVYCVITRWVEYTYNQIVQEPYITIWRQERPEGEGYIGRYKTR